MVSIQMTRQLNTANIRRFAMQNMLVVPCDLHSRDMWQGRVSSQTHHALSIACLKMSEEDDKRGLV